MTSYRYDLAMGPAPPPGCEPRPARGLGRGRHPPPRAIESHHDRDGRPTAIGTRDIGWGTMTWRYDQPGTTALLVAERRLQTDLRAKPHSWQLLAPRRLSKKEQAVWGFESGSPADTCPIKPFHDAFTHWCWNSERSFDRYADHVWLWDNVVPRDEKLRFERVVAEDKARYEREVEEYLRPYMN